MRFAILIDAIEGTNPVEIAETLARQAWESPQGAGYCAFVGGFLMMANAGQTSLVALSRWEEDAEAGPNPNSGSPNWRPRTVEIVGGIRTDQLGGYLIHAMRGLPHHVPLYGEWTNVAVVYNPGTDPGLPAIRLAEDIEAKGRWFDSRKQ